MRKTTVVPLFLMIALLAACGMSGASKQDGTAPVSGG
jgi:hypothetical protein